MTKTTNKVFVLFEKRYIEDYYQTLKMIGVYASHEEAEQAIAELEILFRSWLLDQWYIYANSQEKTPEYWEGKKSELQEILDRKQEGSNAWIRVKVEYDKTVQTLENGSYAKVEPFDVWKRNREKAFKRENFLIKGVEIGQFSTDPHYFLPVYC